MAEKIFNVTMNGLRFFGKLLLWFSESTGISIDSTIILFAVTGIVLVLILEAACEDVVKEFFKETARNIVAVIFWSVFALNKKKIPQRMSFKRVKRGLFGVKRGGVR